MSSIFVSSTFQDMQQERDILQNSVLPKIKEFAKQYGKNIDLCDLRWGVNSTGMSEAESTAKVLQVCFDEIDRARPFFIAILGDRYGWAPDSEIVEISTAKRNIQAEDMLDKSVTEMEIVYGALKNKNASDVRFYFRKIKNKRNGLFTNRDIPAHYISGSPEDKKRMKTLKHTIEKQFPQQLRTYSVFWDKDSARLEGLEPFAEMVYHDIKDMLVQRWGEMQNLSEYEYQFYQYQYAIDRDDIFTDPSESPLSDAMHPNNVKLREATMHTQNYLLISHDEYGLNMIFSLLCRQYQSANSTVIPYECSQSALSSSFENMTLYFNDVLARRLDQSKKEPQIQSFSDRVVRFHELLDALDKTLTGPMILAIRNIHYLDIEGILDWLPLKKYKHFRFLISCNKPIAGPSRFKEITSEFYFTDNGMFSRSHLIRSYMAYYHKELDDRVCFALLDKSEGKDDQYLKLLMQRLLVLTQNDFEAIKNSGDGMEMISRYLQNIVLAAPDNTADFVLEQISLLEAETSPGFVSAVLAILSILPYGISRHDLSRVLKSGNIAFSTLDMTLLCRRLPTLVNVTLDEYYRMPKTPVAKIISNRLIAERTSWITLLENDLSHLRDPKQNEFYRNQYLEIALRTQKRTALGEYLTKIDHDIRYAPSILYRLVQNNECKSNFIENLKALGITDIKWLVTELYNCWFEKNMFMNRNFALQLIDFWKELLSCRRNKKSSSEEQNYILFRLLYGLGELAYLHGFDDAGDYLLEAKSVSKDNFKKYPNLLWKRANGVPLTDEEKRKGQGVSSDTSNGDTFMAGFGDEVQDLAFEQSWSGLVYKINNYLAKIYRNKGDSQTAEELESESLKYTLVLDSWNKKSGEIAQGITVLWPDNPEDEEKAAKSPYRPDIRRNSAIDIGKEAHELHKGGHDDEALLKYTESIGILKEIYEDGKTGKYYDLRGADDRRDEYRKMIQAECARDIGLSFYRMVFCVKIDESNVQLRCYLDELISWAHVYDDYRNNKQSKSDLEQYYLVSAKVYSMFDNTAHFDRILRDIDQYLTYRLEAHMKGAQTDKGIMEDRSAANSIFYQAVTENPQMGPQATELLLRQSNASVKANDFNGFLQLTYLAESLLQWMWEHSLNWTGEHCSLEDVFFNNISNQCMLWEQQRMENRLKQDADRIVGLLCHVSRFENVLLGIQSILRYAVCVFRSGKYQDAVPYADAMFDAIQKTDLLPALESADVYEKLIAIYSEAGLPEKAHETAIRNETLLERMSREGYTEELRSSDITPSQYKFFVISKMMITYLNHAIALSGMKKTMEAKKYLDMAEQLAKKHPEIAASEAGIMQRIEWFKKNGFPKQKQENDPEKIYRQYTSEIEAMLDKCIEGESYDASFLRQILSLIEKMTDMPEHEIYKNPCTIARYYYMLNTLFAEIDCKDSAYEMLNRAADIALNDGKSTELYAEIFSDLAAYESETESKLEYLKKSLAIYENLQKTGKEFSQNSYAVTLYNIGSVLIKLNEHESALEYMKKAESIWNIVALTTNDTQAKKYAAQAKRAIDILNILLS